MKKEMRSTPALFSTGAHIPKRVIMGQNIKLNAIRSQWNHAMYSFTSGIDLAYTSFQAFSCFSRKSNASYFRKLHIAAQEGMNVNISGITSTYLGEGDIAISVL